MRRKSRDGLFGHADGLRDYAGVGKCVGARGVLFLRDAEKDDSAQAQFDCLGDFVGQHVGEIWKLPGMAAIGCFSALPGRIKSGRTRSAGEMRVSFTSSRTAGL